MSSWARAACVGLRRGVGIDAGAGVEAGHSGLAIELAADVEGLMHLGGLFADADGEDCADAGVEGAREHGLAVIGVALAVEVGVGIDQQQISGGGSAPLTSQSAT